MTDEEPNLKDGKRGYKVVPSDELHGHIVDVINAGGGNDTFLVDDDMIDFAASIDGGTGTDTMIFESGSGTIDDEAALSSVLTDVEIIDFTNAGVVADLNLSSADIQAMTDAGNVLTLEFDGGDNVAITDPVANWDVITIGTTTTYTIYNDAIHTTELAQLVVNT